MLQNFPLTINTFSELRLQNCLYVDKTQYVYKLLTTAGSTRYFLSRPRRFGKSLLVSTLEETLKGNKEFFEGLWIAQSDYKWKKHAVITLDFSRLDFDSAKEFLDSLISKLHTIAASHEVTLEQKLPLKSTLSNLIEALYKKYGAVAVLIDEYDKPILDNIANKSVAEEIREKMNGFFSLIKSHDAFVDFAFITGVTSFSKSGLFSGINNLRTISLNDQYSAICGYTDEEIEQNFAQHITELAAKEKLSGKQVRTKIKQYYNGYRFGEENAVAVYNPFSIGYALAEQKFENYWFASGTPTFLVKLLKEHSAELNKISLEIDKSSLQVFDITDIAINVLLFQAGYLTIESYNSERKRYKLTYPNLEVEESLQVYLLEVLTNIKASKIKSMSGDLYDALIANNIEQMVDTLQTLFASIPYPTSHESRVEGELQSRTLRSSPERSRASASKDSASLRQLHISQEAYYHSLLHMAFISGGIKAQSEFSTSHGRIDLIIELPKIVYLIEIKFNKAAKTALTQIKKSKYYEQFTSKKPIVLVGLNFERKPKSFKISYVSEEL